MKVIEKNRFPNMIETSYSPTHTWRSNVSSFSLVVEETGSQAVEEGLSDLESGKFVSLREYVSGRFSVSRKR